MKGFKLDNNGDVVIEKGRIQMVDGDELTRQTCQTVIGTNKGEWFNNPDEGINFRNIIRKNPEKDVIRSEILLGLQQVDETFYLTSFSCEIDEKRYAEVKFEAVNSAGSSVTVNQTI